MTNDLEGVYVCDMGVTRLKQVAEATVTCATKGPGTYPYMAPEMFRKAKRSAAVDIYSLGCLYLELFAKRRVWLGLDATEIMMKVCGFYNTPPCMPDERSVVAVCSLSIATVPTSTKSKKCLQSLVLNENSDHVA